MRDSSEREKLLKLLRNRLLDRNKQLELTETNEDIFVSYNEEDPVMVFAEKLSKGGGKFVYCQNEDELFSKLKTLISYRQWSNPQSFSNNLLTFLKNKGIETTLADKDVKVGISLCQGIIAKTGSIVITSTQGAGTHLTKFPQVFIVIAMTSQIFKSYKQIINLLPETPPKWIISIKSGKLIEEEIKELYLFVVEE
jgi:L-lactate dehydrogenase complex protein LldG